MNAQMVIEEELKELKELNDDLQQKLTSAEEKCDNAMENYSKEIAKSNEKVLGFLGGIFIQSYFILCTTVL